MKTVGKVALITGGTGGLGKAFAIALLNGNAAAVSYLFYSLLYHTYNNVIILEVPASNSAFGYEKGLHTQCTLLCERLWPSEIRAFNP